MRLTFSAVAACLGALVLLVGCPARDDDDLAGDDDAAVDDDAGDDDAVDGDAGDDDAADDDAGDDDAGDDDTAEAATELLVDPHFQRGFTAMDPDSGAVVGDLSPGLASGDPVWQLGQWGSRTSLSDATPTALASGAVLWEDAYGSLTIGPSGSDEADLILYVNAYEEYGGVYREADATETWPHLLGEQRISPPDNPGPGCPPLSEITSLNFSVDARLLFDDRHIGPGYDPDLHAAQYLMYFTVQNLGDPTSPGYGDYLWFGITLYDDRDTMPGLSVSHDDGTGRLIYNIGLDPLTGESLVDNQWHALSVDFLPHVLLALDEAWSLGYLADSHDLADYRIGGMNLGWEIPGLNAASLQIRDLSLTYTDGSGGQGGQAEWLFDTDHDTEGWTSQNLQDPNGGPVGGLWILTADQNDPMLLSPALSLDAADYTALAVRMANDHNPADASHMQVFWSSQASPGFSEGNSLWVDVDDGGGWATYTLDLAAHAGWNGTIDQLRIDPIQYGDGHSIGIDSVRFLP